jgi:hypothetical protein
MAPALAPITTIIANALPIIQYLLPNILSACSHDEFTRILSYMEEHQQRADRLTDAIFDKLLSACAGRQQ